MNLYGILTLEATDSSGETIVVDGIQDLDKLPGTPVSFEFQYGLAVGLVVSAAKVTDGASAEPELLKLAEGRPFVRVEVGLRWPALVPVGEIGFGIGGSVIGRQDDRLTDVRAKDVALTLRPVHPALRAFEKKE